MDTKHAIIGAPASKKIRMTMACERCRSKKVKCDFVHPYCSRCQQAKAQCSYDGSATQIDLFNLVKLNETVAILQKRVESIESDIKYACNNTQYIASEARINRTTINVNHNNDKSIKPQRNSQENDEDLLMTTNDVSSVRSILNNDNNRMAQKNDFDNFMSVLNTQWSLSVTPKGLRIDTNIASLHDLYDVLLSGVSQFDLSNNAKNGVDILHDNLSQSSSTAESPRLERTAATILRKKPLWKSRLKTFPLYSSWEPPHMDYTHFLPRRMNIYHEINNKIDDPSTISDIFPRETLEHLITIFSDCFLCFRYPDPANSVLMRFKRGTLDSLLANSVFAWTARHAAVYHNFFPGQDPNQVGEPFFLKAKTLIKDRFMKTSIDTMYSLLIMYIYAIGIPSHLKEEMESEAYMYLGLAIRMCLDLKMNLESTSTNPIEKEINRRFFWVLYFLETLASVHSDKAFSLPPRSMITVQFPTLMEHELVSSSHRYRIEFIIERFKITSIYRNIIHKTADERLLLSQISAIDQELKTWYDQLPTYFKYKPGDIHKRVWDSQSFREQACIKLNFEYNYQLCQLYGIFVSNSGVQQQQPSTIEILSKNICLKAASNTVELLECWVQLKQLWCHFSLENLMMATMIYGNILPQPNNNEEQEVTKKKLKRIAKILLSSPIRHHKYALALVKRIDTLLRETTSEGLFIDDELASIITGIRQPPLSSSSSSQKNPLPPTPSPVVFATDTSEASTIPSSTRQNHRPSVSNNLQSIPLLINQVPQRNSINNVLDVAPASSAFDIHKTSAISEEMQFTNFVVDTSTLLNYDTTAVNNNNTGILPNVVVAVRGEYANDKKQEYTSELYLQQQQQQQQQQHTYDYGYAKNSSSSSNNDGVNNNNIMSVNTSTTAVATQPVLLNQSTNDTTQYIRILTDFNEEQSQSYHSTLPLPPLSPIVPSSPLTPTANAINHYYSTSANNYSDPYN